MDSYVSFFLLCGSNKNCFTSRTKYTILSVSLSSLAVQCTGGVDPLMDPFMDPLTRVAEC